MIDFRDLLEKAREVKKERYVRLDLSESNPENLRNIRAFLGKKHPDFVIMERVSYLGGLVTLRRKIYDSKDAGTDPPLINLMMYSEAELAQEQELRRHG